MATSAVVQIGSSEERLAFGMNRSGSVPARGSSAGVWPLTARGGAWYLPCFLFLNFGRPAWLRKCPEAPSAPVCPGFLAERYAPRRGFSKNGLPPLYQNLRRTSPTAHPVRSRPGRRATADRVEARDRVRAGAADVLIITNRNLSARPELDPAARLRTSYHVGDHGSAAPDQAARLPSRWRRRCGNLTWQYATECSNVSQYYRPVTSYND